MSAQEFKKALFVNQTDTLPYSILFPLTNSELTKDTTYKIKNPEGFPLIVFFHGSGERGKDNEKQIIHIKKLFTDSVIMHKYPAFIVAPQCPPGKRWVETDWTVSKHIMPETPSFAMVLTMKLIEEIVKKYPVNQKKIYVTGLSMGGFATWDIISRYPGKFAAAIPICGGADVSKAKLLKNTPVWAFHGSNDKVVNVILTRDMIKAIENCGGKPKYTEYKGVGHDSWVKAYSEKELMEWLFKQAL
jgi:predicted peptidase